MHAGPTPMHAGKILLSSSSVGANPVHMGLAPSHAGEDAWIDHSHAHRTDLYAVNSCSVLHWHCSHICHICLVNLICSCQVCAGQPATSSLAAWISTAACLRH